MIYELFPNYVLPVPLCLEKWGVMTPSFYGSAAPVFIRTCLSLLRPHSIILATSQLQAWSKNRPGFRQVRAGLRHAVDQFSTFFVENLVANLLHQSRHVEIDAAGLLVRARARHSSFQEVILCKIPTGSSLTRTLNTGGLYKFRDS